MENKPDTNHQHSERNSGMHCLIINLDQCNLFSVMTYLAFHPLRMIYRQ